MDDRDCQARDLEQGTQTDAPGDALVEASAETPVEEVCESAPASPAPAFCIIELKQYVDPTFTREVFEHSVVSGTPPEEFCKYSGRGQYSAGAACFNVRFPIKGATTVQEAFSLYAKRLQEYGDKAVQETQRHAMEQATRMGMMQGLGGGPALVDPRTGQPMGRPQGGRPMGRRGRG